MNDLTIAILILGALSGLFLFAGLRAGRHPSARFRLTVQLLAVTLMPIYFLCFWNRPVLAWLLPTSGLIILANWLPLWGSFFLGMYLTSPAVSLKRRGIIGGFTLAFVAYSGLAPLFGEAPQCGSQFGISELQFQTTPHTCSAACAASVLRLYGIVANEAELADLCLTREGTHWMGLYRGMMLKTKGTPWTVVAEEFNGNALTSAGQTPCVLALSINTAGFSQDIDHGFQDGVGHSVVFLGRSSGNCITVFDPSPEFGIEDWSPNTVSCIESGVIIRLVPRDDRQPSRFSATHKLASMLLKQKLTAGL